MGMTSPAEAMLDARIRPDITALRSRTAPRASGRPQRRPEASGKVAPIRLTRRGRVVMGVLVAICAALVGLLWLAIGQAEASSHLPRGGSPDRGMTRVVVRPGQTLWSIAVHADPSADPRIVIGEIVSDNALSGTGIQAGQILWVPRG
jgi:nucleoid-associated protein YgaU